MSCFSGCVGQFVEEVQHHVVRRPMLAVRGFVGHLRFPPADGVFRRSLPHFRRVVETLQIVPFGNHHRIIPLPRRKLPAGRRAMLRKILDFIIHTAADLMPLAGSIARK